MHGSRWARLLSVPLSCAVIGGAAATPAFASSARSGSTPRAKVDGGVNAAAIPNAAVFGSTPAHTAETVSFVFKARNLSQLESQAQSGFTSHLSVSQFTATYGQPASVVDGLRQYLAGYGISSSAFPNNLDVVAHGTAGEFDAALAVTQKQYSTPAVHGRSGQVTIPAQKFHGISSDPSLPSSIASNILAVLGLTNYSPMVSNLAHVSTKVKATAGKGGSSSCTAVSGLPADCHTPADFASMYGLDPLYADGAAGQGQTLGIVTFASLDPGAPQHFWKHVVGVNRTGSLSSVKVDGGAGAPSWNAGSGETDLDVEQSGALAPAANVVVYEAPNTDYGFVDGFFAAATQNVAGSVSSSWGESETYIQALVNSGQESPGFVQAVDESFLELAAQGQAGFVASGDEGAYYASADLGTTNLGTGNADDSPYITDAGGSTLPWSATLTSSSGTTQVPVSVPQQRIWGWDYLWGPVAQLNGISLLSSAEQQVVGSGGGFSVLESSPSYQQGVSGTSSYTAVPYLTPTDFQSIDGLNLPTGWTLNPTPGTITGTATGRAEPDLAANADPYTGYVLYAPSNRQGGYPALGYGWGGTSFVAPQLNGATAVIDSLLHRRVGFWNPAIYRFATSSQTPFTPLDTPGTSNDNIYYSGTPGDLFNPGAGLGLPNLAKLAFDFASNGS